MQVTTTEARFLGTVVDDWLARMEDLGIPDPENDSTDVDFLAFIHDLRARLAIAGED